MRSVYGQRFWGRVAAATRAGWACLIVGAVLEYSPVKDSLSLPVFSCVLAIVMCEVSLGKVLQNVCWVMAVSILVIGTSMLVFRVIIPPLSIAASLVCIAIFSVVLTSTPHLHMLAKKVGLAEVAVLYITARMDPAMDRVFYPLHFLWCTALGGLAAIVAMCLPWPRLAVVQVQISANAAALSSSELFKTVTSAFSTLDPTLFSSTCLHAKMLARAATDVFSDLKEKQADTYWELRGWGSRPAFKHLTRGLNGLNLHLTGMEIALQSGFVLDSPGILRATLKDCLNTITEQSSLLLEQAIKIPLFQLKASPAGFQKQRASKCKLVEDAKEIMNVFDQTLKAARVKAYYSKTVLTERLHSDSGNEDLDPLLQTGLQGQEPAPRDFQMVKRSFRARVATYFFLFNLRQYFLEAMNLLDAGHKPPSKLHQVASAGVSMPTVELSVHGSSNSETLSEVSGEFMKKFTSPSTDGDSQRSTGTTTGSTQGPAPAQTGDVEYYLNVDADGDNQNTSVTADPAMLQFRPSLRRQCSHRNPMERLRRNAGVVDVVDNPRSGLFRLPKKIHNQISTLNNRDLIKAVKASLSMIVATVLGSIFLKNDVRAYWATVTVAFIIGSYQGGSFRLASLRLQGTVAGSVYGYLALTGLHAHRYLVLVALVPWVVFSSFLRYSKAYGYMGLVSAFTAAIFLLGGESPDISIQKFTLDRITETFIGVMCFVIVETVVLPQRAVILVREELVSSLIGLRDCVAAIIAVYTGQECAPCRHHAVEEIRMLERQLRVSFAKQAALQAEAVLEPDLWFVPFPGAVYSKLISIEGRMLDLLFFMVCSLHASTEDCISGQMDALLAPLRTSLRALEDEVLSTIDSLQQLLLIKTRKRGRLTSWIGSFLCKRDPLTEWQVAPFSSSTPNAHVSPLAYSTQDRNHQSDINSTASRECNMEGNTAANGTSNAGPQKRSNGVPMHPLVVLGHRKRAVDGTPLNLQFTMDSFEQSYENVLHALIEKTKAEPNPQILENSVMLSFNSLTFSLHSLLRETVELENAVHELLQAENPWSVLDFWDTYSMRQLWQSPSSQSP